MSTLRVVLIDDAEFVRDAVAASLRNAGHEIVGHAGDGAGGLRETLAHRPDLVITDWRMPVMDGVEATRQIRAAHPSAAIIAFTSTDTPELRDAFRVAGAAAFVTKGDVRGLVAAVRAIAGRPDRTQDWWSSRTRT
jgi:DNA-binding NarL/FixJ family response regulator